MNTIILVSVLSTLGVVAIVTAVVVAFMKMNRKVDVKESEMNLEFERVYGEIVKTNEMARQELESLNRMWREDFEHMRRDRNEEMRNVYNDFERYRDEVDKRFDGCFSFIDSRCDKLDNKICGKNCKCKPTEKQLLTD